MAKKWIKSAINPAHKGELKEKAEHAGESTHEFAEKHKHDSSKTGAQSRLALTLMGMHKGGKKDKPKAKSRPNLYGEQK